MDPPHLFTSPIIPLFSFSLCSNSVIHRSKPFAEQLEDITSNLCELLFGANKGELSPAVLSRGASLRFRTVQGAPLLGYLAKIRRRRSFLISRLPTGQETPPLQSLIPNHPITSLFFCFPEWAPHLQGSTPTYLIFPGDSLSVIFLSSSTLSCPSPILTQSQIQFYIHLPYLPAQSNFPFIFQHWDS